jgi:glycosyltransferase involved in cell wall biosynthesis
MKHLAVLTSHPIQYQAPLFRELSRRLDLTVLFAHRATKADQAAAGFGVGFEWDVDLLSGYDHRFLKNVSIDPGVDRFWGCDTPEIGDRLRDGNFDALLVTGWHLKCFWQAILAAKRAGIPVMVRGDSHLKTPRSLLKRASKALIYPMILRVFDVALYVGEGSLRYWQRYGFPSQRLVFSPHCVDNEWFAARAGRAAREKLRAAQQISYDTKVALFAGKLQPIKRPLDLISATKALNSGGCDLAVLVAGSGPLGEQMTAAARAAEVTLIQLGFCNQTEMPAIYAAADMLVLPSESETWGLVANEALACGIPIVVSDACGCAPDLAADKLAGRVFSVGDTLALAAVVKDLIEHPPLREEISAKAACYSISAAVDGVISGIEVVAKRKKTF